MLAIILGIVSVGLLFAMYRVMPLSAGEAHASKRKLLDTLFSLWIIFASAYHLSYFLLVGFSSWFAMVPAVTGTMVVVGLILRKVTHPNPTLDPVDHSAVVEKLFTISGLLTFLFLIIPFGFSGVI